MVLNLPKNHLNFVKKYVEAVISNLPKDPLKRSYSYYIPLLIKSAIKTKKWSKKLCVDTKKASVVAEAVSLDGFGEEV